MLRTLGQPGLLPNVKDLFVKETVFFSPVYTEFFRMLLYVIICRSYKLLKWSSFLAQPVPCLA